MASKKTQKQKVALKTKHEAFGAHHYVLSEPILEALGRGQVPKGPPGGGANGVDPRVFEEYKRTARVLAETQKVKKEIELYNKIENGFQIGTGIVASGLAFGKIARIVQGTSSTAGGIRMVYATTKGKLLEKVAQIGGVVIATHFPLVETELSRTVKELEAQEAAQAQEYAKAAQDLKHEVAKCTDEAAIKQRFNRDVDEEVEKVIHEKVEAGDDLEKMLKGVGDLIKQLFGFEEQKQKQGSVSAQAVVQIAALTKKKKELETRMTAQRANIAKLDGRVHGLQQKQRQAQKAYQDALARPRQLLQNVPIRRVPFKPSPTLRALTQRVFSKEESDWRQFVQVHQRLFGNQPMPFARYTPLPPNSPQTRAQVERIGKLAAEQYLAQITYR